LDPFIPFSDTFLALFFSSFAAAAAVYIIKTRMTQDLPHDLLAVRACIPLPFSFFLLFFTAIRWRAVCCCLNDLAVPSLIILLTADPSVYLGDI